MLEHRIVISNATPIIALALVQQLDLLHKLYREVWIPPAVKDELLAGGTRAGAFEVQAVEYIRTVSLADPRRADLLSDLDRGEAEVIALAQERDADLVIIAYSSCSFGFAKLPRRASRPVYFTGSKNVGLTGLQLVSHALWPSLP